MPKSTAHLYPSDQTVVRYAHWVIRWRWPVLVLSLLAAVAIASGARLLTIRGDYRYNFGENNPQLAAFEEIQATYSKNDNVLFALVPNDGDAFSPRVLEAVYHLTEACWQLPYSTRVDSVTNYQHSYAVDDDLIVEDLVEDLSDLDAARLSYVRKAALAEPLLTGRLVSLDGHATGVNVTVQLPDDTASHETEVLDEVDVILAEFEAKYPDITFAVSGDVVFSATVNRLAERDVKTLTPVMYLVLLVMMVIFLRSMWATAGTLLVIGASAASAMGMAGWLGIPMTPQAVMAPTIILTVAVADGIHIAVSLAMAMRGGMTKRDGIVESLRLNMGPVFLTSLTTAIGFLSLNFGDAPPFADLGNVTTMGVGFAWFYSVTVLPAFLAIVPYRARGRSQSVSMGHLADFLIRRKEAVLMASAALTLVAGMLIPRIELNDMFLNFFHPSTRFRADTDYMREHLTGVYLVDYSIESGASQAINEPEYLERIDEFANWLREKPEVLHVSVLSDTMRRLNRSMNGDDEAFYVIPQERELAAQYLLLYEMSLPYGLDLNNQINIDKSAVKVTVTFGNISAREMRQSDAEAHAWLQEHGPEAQGTLSAGTSLMFANLSDRNIRGMIRGTSLAFLLISLTLVVSLRSIRLGLLSLIPNLVPTVLAFGLWALLVGQVGFAVSMVTACSLGLIVDATVHFLSKYQRAQREQGASAEEAVRYALQTVGSALWVAFLVLLIGFAVLTLSPFGPNAVLGQLIAITIGAAFLSDFLLLPTLLMVLEGIEARGRGASR